MNNFRVLQRALLLVIGGAFVSPQLAHADVPELINKLTDLKGKLGALNDALKQATQTTGSSLEAKVAQAAADLNELTDLMQTASDLEVHIADSKKAMALMEKVSAAHKKAGDIQLDASSDAKQFAAREKIVKDGKAFAQKVIDLANAEKAFKEFTTLGGQVSDELGTTPKGTKARDTYEEALKAHSNAQDVKLDENSTPQDFETRKKHVHKGMDLLHQAREAKAAADKGAADDFKKAQDQAKTLIAELDTLIQQATTANAKLNDDTVATDIKEAQKNLIDAQSRTLTEANFKDMIMMLRSDINLGKTYANKALTQRAKLVKASYKAAYKAAEAKFPDLITVISRKDSKALPGETVPSRNDLLAAQKQYAEAMKNYLAASSNSETVIENALNDAIKWAVVAEAAWDVAGNGWGISLSGPSLSSVKYNNADAYKKLVYTQFTLVLGKMTKDYATKTLKDQIAKGTNEGFAQGSTFVTTNGKDKDPRYLSNDAKKAVKNAIKALLAAIDANTQWAPKN